MLYTLLKRRLSPFQRCKKHLPSCNGWREGSEGAPLPSIALHGDNTKDPAQVDKIMKDLDFNGDGQVDFQEYMVLVGKKGQIAAGQIAAV
uniref:EF-hand domain-containing protein n=1 Tax=Leptobrachium leishanense TaxID=445787 RepID=A0A8C5Q150_9ANUR